jgi:sec-independent protein translocase protein TatC
MTDPNEEKLPLTSHLEELRKRLIRSMIAVGIAFGLCFNYKERLFEIIARPLTEVLPPNSYLIYTGLPEAFFTYLKIAFYAGLFVSSPYILYQIWAFISPGLYKKEKKYVVPFVLTSTLLFIAGVLFGYFLALPPAFRFFVEFTTDYLKPMLSLKEYLSLTLKLLLAFGIVFEIPVFLFFLSKIGIVNARMLARQRKYAILIIFIVAAIITPTPDAFTQCIMAVPMMILYEIGILVVKIGSKKKTGNEDAGQKTSEENHEKE